MKTITDIRARLYIGSQVDFKHPDGRHCKFYAPSKCKVWFFNNFDSRYSVKNDAEVFTKYSLIRKLNSFTDVCEISTLLTWLNRAYGSGWAICSKVYSPEKESNVKPIKNEFMSLINETYTKNELYCYLDDYHSHIYSELNTPIDFRGKYKVGVEMEVEFNSEDNRESFVSNESNWFYCESDGSLDCETGCEIITVPLRPSDAKDISFWEPLTSRLSGECLAWDAPSCGLHVHFSRSILGLTENKIQDTMGKLLYLYHHKIKGNQMNTRIFGRERCYSEHDGRTQSGDAVELLGSDVLRSKRITKKVGYDIKKRSEESRYFDINITNRTTIEFRKGRGTINPKRVVMIVEYCELMCLYAKAAKWSELSFAGFVDYLKENATSEMLKSFLP